MADYRRPPEGELASERALWRAVLLRAWLDLTGQGLGDLRGDPTTAEDVREDVLAWIGGDDFKEVCEMAGYAPGAVARKMLGALDGS